MDKQKVRYVSFFTGGGGADIGVRNAGGKLVCGYEYEPEIAEWCEKQLGHPVRVVDILKLDVGDIPEADYYHFSPPCPSFSRANKNSGETENDLALARKIVEIIEHGSPKIVTLENVWQYRKAESYKMIASCLNDMYGFGWDVRKANFADLGVPQTRERMIVRAVKGMLPPWPEKEEWVGWYRAVEDIIHTFPEGKLANWQIERLPKELRDLLVTSGSGGHKIILNSTDSGKEARWKPRNADEPMQTVTTTTRWKVLLSGNNSTSAVKRDENEPSQTVRASRTEVSRIMLLDHSPSGKRDLTVRDKEEPAMTLMSGKGSRISRLLSLDDFTVLKVTQRGIARFQSFPDWYELPDKKTLSNTIIGNSVPPLGMEKIARPLISMF